MKPITINTSHLLLGLFLCALLFDIEIVLRDKPLNIVMLGDSITHGYEADWGELLARENVINRGVGGATSGSLLDKIDTILLDDPKICILMIGVNDIALGKTVEETFENIIMIISYLKINNIYPILQAVLLTSNYGYNRKIKRLNKMLSKFSLSRGIVFINLNEIFSTDLRLNVKYSADGLHLKPKTYKLWGDYLKPILSIRNL